MGGYFHTRYRSAIAPGIQIVAALVLASTSPYRRELLARLGVAFECLSPGVDETLAAGEAPQAAALRLARAKAKAAAALRPDACILAGDQLASLEGLAIGKPRDGDEARRVLADMSGRTLNYYTAIALIVPDTGETETFLDESRVHLRRFDAGEIARYVAAANPVDCAGALKLEGLGAALAERIETEDPTALIGLPLIATARLLRAHGFTLP
jgi:septum formation protein